MADAKELGRLPGAEWMKALDGPDEGKVGQLLYTPDEDGNWFELRAPDGAVIVSKNAERTDAPNPSLSPQDTPLLKDIRNTDR